MQKKRDLSCALLLLLGLLGWHVAPALERPAGLEPDIRFWRQVFTEISTNEGYLHDSRHLDVIYETIRLPERHTPEQRRRITRAATDRYAAILRDLAAGRRDASDEHRRVLALWGEDADARTLRGAADNIRFQLGQSDRFLEGLIRSGLWAEHIERTLEYHGVPREVIALPHVESAFHPGAQSHAGAVGLWQFIPSTGRLFLRIDALMDERLDPFRATEAAARLLRRNYEATGTWALALSAYNHGAAGIQRAIRAVGTTDIETIVREYNGRAFGFASRNFYVSFLAALDVREDAEAYFGPVQRLRPDETDVMVLPAYASLAEIAVQIGVDRTQLARLNPALRAPILDGSKRLPRGYALRIPGHLPASGGALLAALPESLWHAEQVPDQYHVVQRGETLSVIAPRYGTTVQQIVNLNGLSSAHRIRAGQRLVLPGAPEAAGILAASEPPPAASAAAPVPASAPAPAPAPAPAAAARAAEEPAPALAERTQPAAMPAAASSASQPARALPAADGDEYSVASDDTIVVREEESLGHYADWLGLPTSALRRHNGMSGTSFIRVGDRLALDFSAVSAPEFERRRRDYHRNMQELFLSRFRVADVLEHVVRPGESVWLLAEREYGVPFWLLRHYNPDLDLTRVRPGTRMVIPRLESVEA